MPKKNTQGGSKFKSMARKDMGGKGDGKLLLSADPLEKYAMVTKMLGNGMFYAIDEEEKQYLGHIRNKFRGKSKRQNMISVGSIILLGLREWENPHKTGDLIHIYDPHDIESLHLSFPTNDKNADNADIAFDYTASDGEDVEVSNITANTKMNDTEIIEFDEI